MTKPNSTFSGGDFAQEWNGHSFFYDRSWTRSPDVKLFTEPSGLRFGGVYHPHWFFGGWPHDSSAPIIVRELYPIALASVLWGVGVEWKSRELLFHYDNMAVVDAWKSGTCKNKMAMRKIRRMLACAAKYNFIWQFMPALTVVNFRELLLSLSVFH